MSYCGGSTCHYDTVAQELGSSLALWQRETETLLEGVEAQLVNVPASYQNVTNPDDCPTEPELLVNTSDVEQSLMLKKLLGTHACGAEMPRFPHVEWGTVSNPGSEREEHVACIRQWITLLAEDHGR